MPRLPKNQEKIFLHNIIKALVHRFGRDAIFNLQDIHSGGEGSGSRPLIAAMRDLPEPVVLEHLNELQNVGWVKIGRDERSWTFKVTTKFQDLPDMITVEDIMVGKINFLENKISQKYTDCYEILSSIQKKLLIASNEQDFSEIGNLCVQFWEDFTDELWKEYIRDQNKPSKDRTKEKITPIVKKYIESKTSERIFKALGDLFEGLSEYIQKAKHRSTSKPLTIRDAKMILLLTVILSEEIVFYLP